MRTCRQTNRLPRLSLRKKLGTQASGVKTCRQVGRSALGRLKNVNKIEGDVSPGRQVGTLSLLHRNVVCDIYS